MAHAAVVPQQQQQQPLPVQQQPPQSTSRLVQVAKDVFAGTMGGIAVTMVGHPFDTIKVRLQTQPMDKPIYGEWGLKSQWWWWGVGVEEMGGEMEGLH
jgi:hypothetical protein